MKKDKKSTPSADRRWDGYKIISLLSALLFLGGVKFVFAQGTLSKIIIGDWDNIQLKIGNAILTLASQVLWLAGILFNWVMDYTINFSSLVKNVGVVDVGWTTLRDLSNMVFIFILLIISISIILGISNYGDKKLLTRVILVALLINFSLFATKVIIDSANVFTVGFYNATIQKANQDSMNGWDKGISSMFASSLNLHTIYKYGDFTESSKDGNGATLNPRNIWTTCLMGSVFLVVTAFIFFAASILLIKRIIVLMFLMMLSPLAFLGMILPATSKYSKQWWDTLFKEAFYAPLFMMFIYIVALGINSPAFRESIGKAGSNADGFANVLTGGGASLVIFNFILITGLMLASIITASKLGAAGANGATKFAGKAALGLPAMVGRQTAGRALRPLRDKVAKMPWAQREGFGSKLALKTLNPSFDARNVGFIQDVAKSQKIELGKTPKKITYADNRDKSIQSTYKYTTGMTDTEREAYANKKTNIFSRVVGTGRSEAVRNIQKEYTTKKELKNAMDKLKTDKDLLEARKKLKEGQDKLEELRKNKKEPSDTEKNDVYSAAEAIRGREAKLKKEIGDADQAYKNAKAKTKPKKEEKKKEDKKDKA